MNSKFQKYEDLATAFGPPKLCVMSPNDMLESCTFNVRQKFCLTVKGGRIMPVQAEDENTFLDSYQGPAKLAFTDEKNKAIYFVEVDLRGDL